MKLEEINSEILREIIEVVRDSGASRVRIGDIEVEFSSPESPLERFLGGALPNKGTNLPEEGSPEVEIARTAPPIDRKQGYSTLFGGRAPGFKKPVEAKQ